MDIGFYLKKFTTFFVEPFGLFLFLFFIGLYYLFVKKESLAKIFLTVSALVVLLFSYPPFANLLITNLENLYPKYDYSQSIKYIHVLGNGHNTDKDQPLSSQIVDAGIKRDLEGILIYKKTKDAKLIFTGFSSDTNVPNAKMNAALALALGVKKEDIIINEKPKDTKEEALFTKEIVGDKPFVLVTSATHMPRAMMIFKALGLHPIPAPTAYYKTRFDSYFKAPSLKSFHESKIAMHEYIGILWSKLRD